MTIAMILFGRVACRGSVIDRLAHADHCAKILDGGMGWQAHKAAHGDPNFHFSGAKYSLEMPRLRQAFLGKVSSSLSCVGLLTSGLKFKGGSDDFTPFARFFRLVPRKSLVVLFEGGPDFSGRNVTLQGTTIEVVYQAKQGMLFSTNKLLN